MNRPGTAIMLVLAVSVWLGGCRNDQPAQTANPGAEREGQQAAAPGRDDRGISTRVQARLYQSQTVKTADIDVSTSDGVVTLDGRVPSEEVKQEAVRQARAVEGVARVEDRLEVRDSGAAGTTGKSARGADQPGARPQGEAAERDRDIGDRVSAGWVTAKIQAQYFTDDDVKGRNIDVDTINGVVTLTGEVDSQRARQRAVAIAQKTEGVTRVDDQLRVAAADAAHAGESQGAAAREREAGRSTESRPEVRDEDITDRILSKYFTNEEVRDSQVTVNTNDGVVTLGGTVGSEAERDEAVSIARNTDGVTRVIDEIKVDASPAGTSGSVTPVPRGEMAREKRGEARGLDEKLDDAWITTKIQSKFFLDDTVRSGNVNVVSKDGTVTLHGHVESADAKKKAVQIAENTDGVARVVDRLTVQASERK